MQIEDEKLKKKKKRRRNEKYSPRIETRIEMLVKTIILKEINLNVFECNKIYSSLYQSIRLRLGGLNALRQRNYDSMFIMS